MSQIGNLVNAGNVIFNLDHLPENILVGAPDTDNPCTQLTVQTAGNQLVLLTSASRIRAVSKFDQGGMLGADVKVPMYLRLGVGRINKNTTISMTNGGATTDAVYAASSGLSDIARECVETSINASANASYQGFEALFFLPANVLRATLEFEDGFSDDFTVPELAALFASRNITDADGYLDGHVVIKADMPDDNDIVKATIYNGNGGITTVVKTQFKQI